LILSYRKSNGLFGIKKALPKLLQNLCRVGLPSGYRLRPERDVAANTTQTIKAKWRFRQGSSPAPSISMIAGTCRIVAIFVLRYRGLVHQRLAKRSVAAKHRGLASYHPRKDENTNLD